MTTGALTAMETKKWQENGPSGRPGCGGTHLCNCPFHHGAASQGSPVDNFIVVTGVGHVVFLHFFPYGITRRGNYF